MDDKIDRDRKRGEGYDIRLLSKEIVIG